MADINRIKELALKLNLQNIARGDVDLQYEALSNLDYLEYVLEEEQYLREQAAIVRMEKESRLPGKPFLTEKLNDGTAWQIRQLENLQWIDEEQNIIIVGRCRTGKTALASHLGRLALKNGIRVSYNTVDDFMYAVLNKDKTRKQEIRYRLWLSSSLIIVDDVMYAGMSDEELSLFYHTLMMLNETRSIIVITNRELSSWYETTDDKHLMDTLVERLTGNSQIIRLN